MLNSSFNSRNIQTGINSMIFVSNYEKNVFISENLSCIKVEKCRKIPFHRLFIFKANFRINTDITMYYIEYIIQTIKKHCKTELTPLSRIKYNIPLNNLIV